MKHHWECLSSGTAKFCSFLQNIANVYRKNAFDAVLANAYHWLDEKGKVAEGFGDAANLDAEKSLVVFNEGIDFSLEAAVPDPVPFDRKLNNMLEDHEAFILSHAQRAIGVEILNEVGRFTEYESTDSNKLDTEQEREQEQEQQKEVQARKDQQIEVEKFVDRYHH